jgi:hypothetical protein
LEQQPTGVIQAAKSEWQIKESVKKDYWFNEPQDKEMKGRIEFFLFSRVIASGLYRGYLYSLQFLMIVGSLF